MLVGVHCRRIVARCFFAAAVAGIFCVAISGATLLVERLQRQSDGSVRLNDAIQFWCAGNLILQGRSPYDVEGQASLSAQAGWDRDGIGDGRYDFMPFYYPYWIGLAAAPLSHLDVARFLALWTVLQYAAAFGAAVILSQMFSREYRVPVVALVMLFPLTRQVADMGQVADTLLLGIALLWWSCQRGWDVLAGVVLALVASKPQVAVFLVPCVLVWAMRGGRWRIPGAFVATGAALVALSLWWHPHWISECLAAPGVTPMVTGEKPWLVTTWYGVLRTLGVPDVLVPVLYAALAVPVGLLCLWQSWRVDSTVAPVMAVCLMAVWFAAPYARSYDLVVLLFPILLIIRDAAAERRALWLVVFALAPQAHQWIRWQRGDFPVAGLEIWWMWMPALCLVLWLLRSRFGEASDHAPPSTVVAGPGWQAG